jgi:hypothetical protein
LEVEVIASVDPTLITTVITAIGAVGAIIWTVIKARRRKIIFQDGGKKIHIEGHTFSEELQIIDQIQQGGKQLGHPTQKQLNSRHR